jgi:hypothetical protein
MKKGRRKWNSENASGLHLPSRRTDRHNPIKKATNMPDKTQQIRERAYQIWQEQGQPDGLETDHWRQAEQEGDEAGAEIVTEAGTETSDGATTGLARSKNVGAAAARAVAGAARSEESVE